jgi:hypothetical protein
MPKETFTIIGDRFERVTVKITKLELRFAIFQEIYDIIGDFDDAGCDWFTDELSSIYIGAGFEWCASSGNKEAATLVDAANILLYGHVLTAKALPEGD